MRMTTSTKSFGVLAAATMALTACGSSGSSDGATSATSAGGGAAPVKDGASQVHVTLTNSGGCELDHTSAKAGPVTFTVQNKDATGITEVELQDDQQILAEKENLAPGLKPVSFTSTLAGGKYQVYCPGAPKDTLEFTVTGKAAAQSTGSTAQLLADGAKKYGEWVHTQVAGMVDGVDKLDAAVQKGDVEGAKKAYAQARPFYEKIESDVDGFVLPGFKPSDNKGNLDYLIDMRQSNLDPAVGWHGFHAVERDLWQGGKITDSTKKLSTELKTNVGKLESLTKNATYKPEDLANGAAALLEEVQTEKIKGTEEAYSHLDLLDFNANVEGAQQAFAFLKPGLQKLNPQIVSQISSRFDAVNKSLDDYRDAKAEGGFKTWTEELRKKDAPKLSKTVQSLQDPLSQIAAKVATA